MLKLGFPRQKTKPLAQSASVAKHRCRLFRCRCLRSLLCLIKRRIYLLGGKHLQRKPLTTTTTHVGQENIKK